MRKTLSLILTSCFLMTISVATQAVPMVGGEPVIVQHLGIINWPPDNAESTPYLTQLGANDINDLHGDLSCDLIITTPGNYHMALKDAMKGRADLGFPVGLQEQMETLPQFKVSVCWSTSPPVSVDQIGAENLQFKNIDLNGKPVLAMAPVGVMNTLVNDGLVDPASRQDFLVNNGNVMLIRGDKAGLINSVCDLDTYIDIDTSIKRTRVVTPNPDLEPGSFRNFSLTIHSAAADSGLDCGTVAKADELFSNIFNTSPILDGLDLTVFENPYNIDGVMSVFGRGTTPQGPLGQGAKWVASSRIMHRDIPYALCNDQADAAVIFYHQAVYIKNTLAASGCNLEIVNLDGSTGGSQFVPGNRIGRLQIAKVNGSFPKKVRDARDEIYDFLTTDPIWGLILESHGLATP